MKQVESLLFVVLTRRIVVSYCSCCLAWNGGGRAMFAEAKKKAKKETVGAS